MHIYLVGGAVRDAYLGQSPRERDYVVVGATAADLLAHGWQPLDHYFPVFIDVETGNEYALARREWKIAPGYKGFQAETSLDITLEQDLARRDLTINALAHNAHGQLIDPFNGLADLRAGWLRHITPAFTEDPVRLLRLARFAARFDFQIAPETWALLPKMASAAELTTVVPERLRTELFQALAAPYPWRFFEVLHACGALIRLLPALAIALEQPDALAMNALRRATAMTHDPLVRGVALWVPALPDIAAAIVLSRELRLEREMAALLAAALEWTAARIINADAAELLRFIEQRRLLVDAAAITRLKAVWAALDPELASRAEQQLTSALAALANISATTLLAEGLSGVVLGTELRRRRLQALLATQSKR